MKSEPASVCAGSGTLGFLWSYLVKTQGGFTARSRVISHPANCVMSVVHCTFNAVQRYSVLHTRVNTGKFERQLCSTAVYNSSWLLALSWSWLIDFYSYFLLLAPFSWLLANGSWFLAHGSWHLTPGPGSWLMNPCCWLKAPCSFFLDPGYWLLAHVSWLLAPGNWLLALKSQLLAPGS